MEWIHDWQTSKRNMRFEEQVRLVKDRIAWIDAYMTKMHCECYVAGTGGNAQVVCRKRDKHGEWIYLEWPSQGYKILKHLWGEKDGLRYKLYALNAQRN